MSTEKYISRLHSSMLLSLRKNHTSGDQSSVETFTVTSDLIIPGHGFVKTEEGNSGATMRLLAVFHLQKVMTVYNNQTDAPDPDERVIELRIY